MKTLILLGTMLLSTQLLAAGDKCFKAARQAAFKYAVKEEMVTTLAEFNDLLDSEELNIDNHGSWQKEYWSFYNSSLILNVEVDYAKNKCIVKNVDHSQNDQDED